MEVLHTAVWVSDIERTVAFYTGTLDLEHTRSLTRDGVLNYFVGGEGGTELQFKYDEDADDRSIEPAGIDHLALEVDDVDETVATLQATHGSEVLEGPTTLDEHGVRFAMVTDPDGYVVELIAPR